MPITFLHSTYCGIFIYRLVIIPCVVLMSYLPTYNSDHCHKHYKLCWILGTFQAVSVVHSGHTHSVLMTPLHTINSERRRLGKTPAPCTSIPCCGRGYECKLNYYNN